jgi:fatty-acyl-CoA synthase
VLDDTDEEEHMRGLMMETPLLIPSLVRHAAEYHGGREIVSRMLDGSIHRTTYAETYVRIQRLANALSAPCPRGSEERRLLDAMLLAAPR